MNFSLWFQFLTSVATTVFETSGTNTRALAYLQFLAAVADRVRLTDQELTELQAKYEFDVANNTPITAEELAALRDRIDVVDDAIQQT